MLACADVRWIGDVHQNLNAKSAEVSGIRRERDTNKGGRGQTASEHTLSRLGDHQITKDKSSWRQWRRYEGTLPKNQQFCGQMRLLELVGLNCFEHDIMGSKCRKKKRGDISKMPPHF
jgi:hypothetical protein